LQPGHSRTLGTRALCPELEIQTIPGASVSMTLLNAIISAVVMHAEEVVGGSRVVSSINKFCTQLLTGQVKVQDMRRRKALHPFSYFPLGHVLFSEILHLFTQS